MAFALALQSVHELPDGHGQTIFTATTAIVVLTVILIGGSTATMLEALEVTGDGHSIPLGESSDDESNYRATSYDDEARTSSSSQNLKMRLKELQKSTVSFTAIDKNFLTPFFTARNGDTDGHRTSNGDEARDSARRVLKTFNNEDNATNSPLLQNSASKNQEHHIGSTSNGSSRWLSPGNHLKSDKYRNMYVQNKDYEKSGQAYHEGHQMGFTSLSNSQDGRQRWPS
eukprot:Gb_37252 [translate_table: standard]